MEVVLCQALEKEGDGGNISAVGYLTGSITAGEHTSNSTTAIDDSCARVSTFGECARLRSTRQHGNFPRIDTRVGLEGFTKD